MPTDRVVFICLGLLLCAFVYLRVEFLLKFHAQINFLSQLAELIRMHFDSFVHHNGIAANVVKLFYVTVSICFGYWMRRTRSTITSTPASKKLRSSPMLDTIAVNAIHKFARGEEELKEYLPAFPSSANDSVEKTSTVTTSGSDDITSTSSDNSLTTTSSILKTWIGSFLFSVLGCCTIYGTIHVWISLAHMLSEFYSVIFAVPESIFSFVLPAICFAGPSLGGWEHKFAMYTSLAILCSCFGTFSMILFWSNVWLNLHLTYVATPALAEAAVSENEVCLL